jgi:hypothetical protein
MKILNLICVFILIILCEFVNAQNLKLIPRDPFPRKSQRIELEFLYTNSKTENRFEAYIENGGTSNLIGGTIQIRDTTITNSKINVGPFILKIENKTIESDSIKLQVFNQLPDTNKGIWINQVNVEGNTFLIIEQRIPLFENGIQFASFDLEKFQKNKIEPFEYLQLTHKFQARANNIEKKEYRERKSILLLRHMTSNLIIDEMYFKNLPEKTEEIKLEIQIK